MIDIQFLSVFISLLEPIFTEVPGKLLEELLSSRVFPHGVVRLHVVDLEVDVVVSLEHIPNVVGV